MSSPTATVIKVKSGDNQPEYIFTHRSPQDMFKNVINSDNVIDYRVFIGEQTRDIGEFYDIIDEGYKDDNYDVELRQQIYNWLNDWFLVYQEEIQAKTDDRSFGLIDVYRLDHHVIPYTEFTDLLTLIRNIQLHHSFPMAKLSDLINVCIIQRMKAQKFISIKNIMPLMEYVWKHS